MLDPEPVPVPMLDPEPVPVPVLEAEPVPVPMLVAEPVPVPMLVAEPVPVPVLEAEPVPVPELEAEPVPVPELEPVPVPELVPVVDFESVSESVNVAVEVEVEPSEPPSSSVSLELEPPHAATKTAAPSDKTSIPAIALTFFILTPNGGQEKEDRKSERNTIRHFRARKCATPAHEVKSRRCCGSQGPPGHKRKPPDSALNSQHEAGDELT
jgi:hypothetical protein